MSHQELEDLFGNEYAYILEPISDKVDQIVNYFLRNFGKHYKDP